MANQVIISVGREFGSGGHEIAEKLSKRFGIKLYDRNMLDEIAKEKNVDGEDFEQFDEKPRNPILSRRVNGFSNSMSENIAQMQFDYLKRKADSGESFVVVGRCAEAILKDREGLISLFVLGDKEDKIKRVMDRYNLDEEEALTKMKRHDKTRKYYHNSYAESKWGDSRTYDVCINSSRLGIDKTVDVLEEYIRDRIK